VKKYLTVYLLSLSLSSVGQVNLDSLWGIWDDPAQPDTSRLKVMHDIASEGYLRSNPDSAYYFAQLEYDFAKSKGLKKQMGNAMQTQGLSFFYLGDYPTAKDYYTRSLNIAEEIGDKKGIATSLHNFGRVYYNQDDYASAIGYYTRSLTIKEEIGDKKGMLSSINNIGVIYYLQSDYASAVDYYTRSLNIAEETGDKKGFATSLINIGLNYNRQGDYASAIDFYTRSLNIAEEIGDKKIIATSLHNIGLVYFNRGDHSSALDYYTRSLTIEEEIGDKVGFATSLINIGLIYYRQGNYASAISYSTRAITIAQAVGARRVIRNAANGLYEAYNVTGRHKRALDMYELYIATRDSIDSEENQREVIRQEYKYEYDKQALADSLVYVEQQKVQEAKLEKSKTQQLALIGGLVLFISFSSILYNRFRITSKQKITIESTLDDLKQTQTQLVQSEKMASLGQFTAGVAHEINNPINFVKGGSVALTSDFQDLIKLIDMYSGKHSDEDINALKREIDLDYLLKNIPLTLDDIKTGADRTAKIVEGLRSFSRLDEARKQEVDIHECIDSTLLLISQEDTEHIELVKNYQTDIKPLTCYPGQLNQAFLNIINNARDVMKDGGKLMITTAENNGQVIISFKDTGPGIPNDIKDKIFDPFFTTKDVGQGTGLGLSITHGIIENHEGKIEVNSKEGQGSEFVITLPRSTS